MSLHLPPLAQEQLKKEALHKRDNGEYEEALLMLSEALSETPFDATLWSQRCMYHIALSQYPQALADADQCIQLRPDWPLGFYRRGMVLQLQGNMPEALECYVNGLSLERSDETLIRRAANCMLFATAAWTHSDASHLNSLGNLIDICQSSNSSTGTPSATSLLSPVGVASSPSFADMLAAANAALSNSKPGTPVKAPVSGSISSPKSLAMKQLSLENIVKGSTSLSISAPIAIPSSEQADAASLASSTATPIVQSAETCSIIPPISTSQLVQSTAPSESIESTLTSSASAQTAETKSVKTASSIGPFPAVSSPVADVPTNEPVKSISFAPLVVNAAASADTGTTLPSPLRTPPHNCVDEILLSSPIGGISNTDEKPSAHLQYETLFSWLQSSGAEFEHLYIPEHVDTVNGVFLRESVPAGVPLLRVPLPCIMTTEIASSSPIGQAIIDAEENHGLLLRSRHTLLAAYLLMERRRGSDSFWHPYIQCLPESYGFLPIHFSDDDLRLVQGSAVLRKIIERRESLRVEYAELRRHAHVAVHIADVTLEEFVWARNVVVTRIFGLTIQGRKTDGLVPLADLLNHRRPRETKWAFEDAVNGFVITSLRALEGGQQVHDSYGRKCNSRFFVNYGFALDDNPDNEVSFTFTVPASDPFYAFRMRLLGGNASREFSLNALFSHKDAQTREAFSFLRFLVARGSEVSVLATSKTFTVSDIAPISTQNELRVLEHLRAFAQHALSEFDASLEQDSFILQNESLSEKQRNCIRMRRGEKLVFSKFIKLAEVSTRLLQVNWKELKKIVMTEFASGSGDYDDYIATVIVPLVKAESRQIAQ